MKKYFYSDGKEKNGPLSLKDLKHENISKDTLIWFQGLDDWTKAGDLDEMKPILELQPPPIFNNYRNESTEAEEKTLEVSDKNESQAQPKKKGMFSNPFSFDGRIRRTEYGISIIIYALLITIVDLSKKSGVDSTIGLVYIPIMWFLFAQGAKRCHDVGKNGFWQIIPFYGLWLIFKDGQSDINEYGDNPKSYI